MFTSLNNLGIRTVAFALSALLWAGVASAQTKDTSTLGATVAEAERVLGAGGDTVDVLALMVTTAARSVGDPASKHGTGQMLLAAAAALPPDASRLELASCLSALAAADVAMSDVGAGPGDTLAISAMVRDGCTDDTGELEARQRNYSCDLGGGTVEGS
jgi:hypothetical protein